MRSIITALICTSLVLAAPVALAGTSENPEITDPAGDAGPAQVGLGPAADDLDILQVHFETNEAGTWMVMELSAFEHIPQDTVYGAVFEVDGNWTLVGFAKGIDAQSGHAFEGYGGFQEGSGVGFTELTGERLADRPGFRVLLHEAWIGPGQTIEEPQAGVYAEAFLPGAAEGAYWMAAYPHNFYDLTDTGRDYVVPSGDGAAAGAGQGTGGLAAAGSDGGQAGEGAQVDAPAGAGLGVSALSAAGLVAGLALLGAVATVRRR